MLFLSELRFKRSVQLVLSVSDLPGRDVGKYFEAAIGVVESFRE